MKMSVFFPVCMCIAGIGLHLNVAQATTIDFETGAYAQNPTDQTYTESGYTFTTGLNDHFDSNDFPGNTVFPGGLPFLVFHEAANNPTNNIVTLDFGGAAFDLLSFDLVDSAAVRARNPVINPVMTIDGSDGSSLNNVAGFVGTVDVGFLNVTSVTFDILINATAAGNVLLDNVVVRPAMGNPNPVPLPATGLLLPFALGALALVGRRRRQARPDRSPG